MSCGDVLFQFKAWMLNVSEELQQPFAKEERNFKLQKIYAHYRKSHDNKKKG